MQAVGAASAKALGWNQRGRFGDNEKGRVTGCQGARGAAGTETGG